MQRLERYRRGDHDLPEGHEKAREIFRRFQRKARTNYVGLVADAVRERIKLTGFTLGGGASSSADAEAWRVWQANQMDADFNLVVGDALTFGRSYVIVGPSLEPTAFQDGNTPTITREKPTQVIHAADPVRRRTVRAALKMWVDEVEGKRFAVVYLPDQIAYFEAPYALGYSQWTIRDWQPSYLLFSGYTEPVSVVENTLGAVPVVPFINRPDVDEMGYGEFEDLLDTQDRINSTILDRMVIAKMQAYRQRWMKGVNLEDENGNLVQPFVPGADLVWAVPDETAAFGDFAEANLMPLLAAKEADVTDLAAVSRTPAHYLLGKMVNLAASALKSAETGLISKVLDKHLEWGESAEQVSRLAAAYSERLFAPDSETIWADPESRSMAELADASVKKMAAGVPWHQRMVDLGYSPTTIARMETERAQDAMLQAFANPNATVLPQTRTVQQVDVTENVTEDVTEE